MKVLSASKLKAFQLAGLTGSFKHAAHLLSVSPSTVSARVRSLELDLGVQLFERGIRKVHLTEAGADFIREVDASFASLDLATRELRSRFGQTKAFARRSIGARAAAGARFGGAEHGMVPAREWG